VYKVHIRNWENKGLGGHQIPMAILISIKYLLHLGNNANTGQIPTSAI
jgi:hypothetical protein